MTTDTEDKPSCSTSSSQSNESPPKASFECNICLDTAKDAVVSMCGHLFCWPCLHQWLETRPHRQLCPVCKAAISQDKVIPLYGRGSNDKDDPRKKVPPRPSGQRTESSNSGTGLSGFGFNDGFQMSFGIGAFPFGFFGTQTFNFGDNRPNPPHPHSQRYREEQQLSRFFLFVAAVFLIWLILA